MLPKKVIWKNHAFSSGKTPYQYFWAVFGCQNDTLNFFNDILNSESQNMVLAFLEVKRFEGNMFSWTWLLQQTAAIILCAKFGSENCKYGICALSGTPPRFGLLLSCCRFVQYGVRSCETTLMQLRKCFTVSPLRSACLAMHQTTMKTKGQQLRQACKTRWLSSEATVRARSEFWVFGPHWSSCQKIKMMQCKLFYCDFIKTKIFNMALSFCQRCHFTWQN